MAYEEAGSGEVPLLLVHGYTGSLDDFREQIPLLGAYGRVIALDQRGHGDSSNTGELASYRLETLVEDLAGFQDALALERSDLLGHSMGGMVALRYVLEHPERVRSLILMDTTHRAIEMPRAMFEAGEKIARESGLAALAVVMRKAPPRPDVPEAVLRTRERMGESYWERQRRKLESMDVEAFAGLREAMVEQQPLTRRLAEISCPTLVLVGEQDVPFRKPSDEMAAAIPDARLAVIPEAAHSPQLENAPAWNRAIVNHLERVREREPLGG